MSTLTVGITAVVAAAVGSFITYRAGVVHGREITLTQIRKELDVAVDQWDQATKAGDTLRGLELPGLLAVRRMFGTSLVVLMAAVLSSCSPGQLTVTPGLSVTVDSVRHVACYNFNGGYAYISCVTLDSLNKAAK